MGMRRDLQAWGMVGALSFCLLFLRKETHATKHLRSARSHPKTSPVGVAIATCSLRRGDWSSERGKELRGWQHSWPGAEQAVGVWCWVDGWGGRAEGCGEGGSKVKLLLEALGVCRDGSCCPKVLVNCRLCLRQPWGRGEGVWLPHLGVPHPENLDAFVEAPGPSWLVRRSGLLGRCLAPSDDLQWKVRLWRSPRRDQGGGNRPAF